VNVGARKRQYLEKKEKPKEYCWQIKPSQPSFVAPLILCTKYKRTKEYKKRNSEVLLTAIPKSSALPLPDFKYYKVLLSQKEAILK